MKRGKRNFCKIKGKTRKEKKQGKNYEHWANISIPEHTNDANKWKEEKETSAKLKKMCLRKKKKREKLWILSEHIPT